VQINAWTLLLLQHNRIDKFYAFDEPPLMCWWQLLLSSVLE